MKKPTELEILKIERNEDTEWLVKYKRIVVGLQQIAEINSDACNERINDWTAISCGLLSLAELMQEDIDGRKESK